MGEHGAVSGNAQDAVTLVPSFKISHHFPLAAKPLQISVKEKTLAVVLPLMSNA